MKKSLLTLAIVLLAVGTQAQTAFKIHNDGQISLQSATTSYGIQIPSSGVASFEPNVTTNYGRITKSYAYNTLAKTWCLNNGTVSSGTNDVFYVLGNGNVYSYGQYTIGSVTPGGGSKRGNYPIENASEMISAIKGYYMDSNEFEGVTPETLENSGEILPEALEGILLDLEKGKTIGIDAEELETTLPEAVRHDPEGRLGINYNAIVTVLLEAFKEQQARIDQLEFILRKNGLLTGNK